MIQERCWEGIRDIQSCYLPMSLVVASRARYSSSEVALAGLGEGDLADHCNYWEALPLADSHPSEEEGNLGLGHEEGSLVVEACPGAWGPYFVVVGLGEAIVGRRIRGSHQDIRVAYYWQVHQAYRSRGSLGSHRLEGLWAHRSVRNLVDGRKGAFAVVDPEAHQVCLVPPAAHCHTFDGAVPCWEVVPHHLLVDRALGLTLGAFLQEAAPLVVLHGEVPTNYLFVQPAFLVQARLGCCLGV